MILQKYAVIGHPIGHTMSPFIHKKLFDLAKINAEYGVYDIEPNNLSSQYEHSLKHFNGFNITIPHKQAIISLIDELDEKAKMYGSVNTVSIKNGIAKGHTTDPDGFLMAIKSADIELKNEVVILGCGGVARTMAYETVLKGASLTFAVRDKDLSICKILCDELKENVPNASVCCCSISELNDDSKVIDVLINATPVGMYPNIDEQPISDKVISKASAIFDAVYNPLETIFVKKALSNGSKAIGGMSMLVWQAAVAHKFWNNSVFEEDAINDICYLAAQELRNK